jgi:hypothetical protein
MATATATAIEHECESGARAISRDQLVEMLVAARPDLPLQEFLDDSGYAPEALMLAVTAAMEAGEVEVVDDGYNHPIVCLTSLGADRAGVVLSDEWPARWVVPGRRHRPRHLGPGRRRPRHWQRETPFTDLEVEVGGVWMATWDEQDHKDLPPLEVLTGVEEFAEQLRDGRVVKALNRSIRSVGLDGAWPLEPQAMRAAGVASASTWQALYTRCPFCRHRVEGEACRVCGGLAPARPCPACDGVYLPDYARCHWCERSGVDHLLGRPPVPERVIARRRGIADGKLRGGRR